MTVEPGSFKLDSNYTVTASLTWEGNDTKAHSQSKKFTTKPGPTRGYVLAQPQVGRVGD